MDDGELLKRYVAAGSEEAFRSPVERNLSLVYSAALRKTNNRSMAEDVTQVVFIILAKKAHELSKGTILAGWLHRTTWHVSMKALVTECRRRRREEKAVQMQTAEQDAEWESLVPLLDDALAQLGDVERSAVVLRYFQNRSFVEVGNALGVSDDTAQKKVSRSVDKLRKMLLKRGIAISIATFGGLMATRAAQFAPATLAAQIVPAALRDTGVSGSVYALLEASVKPVLTLKVVGAWSAAAVAGLALAAWAAGSFARPSAPSRPVLVQKPTVQQSHPESETAIANERTNRIAEPKASTAVVRSPAPKPPPIIIPGSAAKVITSPPSPTQAVVRAAAAAPVPAPVPSSNSVVDQNPTPAPNAAAAASESITGNDAGQGSQVSVWQNGGYGISVHKEGNNPGSQGSNSSRSFPIKSGTIKRRY